MLKFILFFEFLQCCRATYYKEQRKGEQDQNVMKHWWDYTESAENDIQKSYR